MKHRKSTGKMNRFKEGNDMEKLKKVMTVMAIAGTVLVTGLFCYMPFRDMFREMNKQEISLEESSATGEPEEDTSSDSQDGVPEEGTFGETYESKEAEEVSGITEGAVVARLQTEVVLSVMVGEQELLVSLWQGDDGTCYFFLPGFGKEATIRLEGVGEKGLLGNQKGSLFLGETQIKAGDVLTDIAWNTPYEMRICEDVEKEGVQVSVIFMCSSDIPVLSLTTRSGNMEYIDEVKGNEEPGELVLFDEQGTELLEEKVASISGRGNSTWGMIKKPYQFKLEESADIFGFGSARSWNLLANAYDETNLRNQLALGLAQALEMNYVPQGKLVDLYINHKYHGCYFLCEEVQVGEERVAIRDMEEMSNLVYRGEELSALAPMQSEDGSRKWVERDVEEADITGGYLFERELEFRYVEEVSGFVTSQGDFYALKSPKYASKEQVDYIGDRMQEFQDALAREDKIHPVTGKHYSEYIDVTSFVQKYLVEEISKNYDGGVASSYFYKPEDAVSNLIFAGPVWDYDVAFGNCNMDKIVSNPIGVTGLDDHVYDTDIFGQLYEDEAFYQAVVALYEEKALPYLNGLTEGGIDRLVEETKEASLMNHIRWEALSNRYQYYTEYEDEIRYLKYFVETRRDFLSEVWLEGAVYHRIEYRINGQPFIVDYVKDGETPKREPSAYKAGALFAGWFMKDSGVPFDVYKPVYEDMIFESVWEELLDGETETSP